MSLPPNLSGTWNPRIHITSQGSCLPHGWLVLKSPNKSHDVSSARLVRAERSPLEHSLHGVADSLGDTSLPLSSQKSTTDLRLLFLKKMSCEEAKHSILSGQESNMTFGNFSGMGMG